MPSILKQKKVIVIMIIILLILIFGIPQFFGKSVQGIISESYIKNEIEKANYCEVEDDCISVASKWPFGCVNIYVNKNEVNRINNLVSSFKYEGIQPMYKCMKPCGPKCEYDDGSKRKKCVATTDC